MSNAHTLTRCQADSRLRASVVGLLAVLALGVSATGASAQFAYGYSYGYARPYPGPAFFENEVPPVSPRFVVFRLQDRGFSEIARPRFDGTAWVVDATDPAGARMRLFVDARTGGVIGRQRLDAPYYPSSRVAHAAPSYGWTEDETTHLAHDPDRLVPPGSIPEPGYGRAAGIDRAAPPPHSRGGLDEAQRAAGRPTPSLQANAADANPYGVNPDAKGDARSRTAAPRKTAKLSPPARPAEPSTTAATATPAPLPTAGTEQPVPAAVPTSEPAATGAAASRSTDKALAEKAPAKEWRDPPASEPKRNVRVIGGATVVPGGTEAPAGAN